MAYREGELVASMASDEHWSGGFAPPLGKCLGSTASFAKAASRLARWMGLA